MTDPFAYAPIWLVGIVLFVAMFAASGAGRRLRERNERRRAAREPPPKEPSDGQEGYVVSAVLGLLALLLGFTFALAVDRYETRRALVLEEANAIGTTYLRAQLLDEPYRARLSELILDYLDNRIVLGETRRGSPLTLLGETRRRDAVLALLAENDRLVTELWGGTVAAFPSMKGYAYSIAFLDTMNHLIDLDAARKTARMARVPTGVFAILVLYLVVASGVLSYILSGERGRITARFLALLLGASLLLIVDIDRPTFGFIREAQDPMLRLRASLAAQPPAAFDRDDEPVN